MTINTTNEIFINRVKEALADLAKEDTSAGFYNGQCFDINTIRALDVFYDFGQILTSNVIHDEDGYINCEEYTVLFEGKEITMRGKYAKGPQSSNLSKDEITNLLKSAIK